MGKVPFEFLGKANQLYRDVQQKLFVSQETSVAVHNKWMIRAGRKGTIRRDHYIDSLRELKQAFHPFAFDFESDYRKGFPYIGFYHLSPAKLHHNGDDEGTEFQLSVRATILDVKKNMQDGDKFLSSWDPVRVSMHAIARWFERNEYKTLDVLLNDLKVVADEAAAISERILEYMKAHEQDDTFEDTFLKYLDRQIEIKCPSGGKFIGKSGLEKTKRYGTTLGFKYAKIKPEEYSTNVVTRMRTYYSKVMSEEE